MLKEAYVSFEIAKLLKEKGFDEPTIGTYYADGSFEYLSLNKWNSKFITPISAPTIQMAMKWLREIHNIFIVIEPNMYDHINEKNLSCIASLWQGGNYYENITSKDYPTYEEACEVAIQYCLENLI